MDRVRFGRALGFGARQAMKTLVTAVDAATAENPSTKSRPAAAPPIARPSTEAPAARPAANPPMRKAVHAAVNTVTQVRQVQQGLGQGGRRLGEAVWGPFVRLSGVLWLEVSGVFFGIFALLSLGYLWKLRAAWRTGAESHRNLLGAIAMFVLFGYFCISNFVQARRRERGR